VTEAQPWLELVILGAVKQIDVSKVKHDECWEKKENLLYVLECHGMTY